MKNKIDTSEIFPMDLSKDIVCGHFWSDEIYVSSTLDKNPLNNDTLKSLVFGPLPVVNINNFILPEKNYYIPTLQEQKEVNGKKLKALKQMIVQYGVDISNADNSANYRDLFAEKAEQALAKIMKEIEIILEK